MRYSYFILFFLITFSSCEKEVKFDMGAGEEKLVVEGTIETGAPPFVMLTRSIGFFSRVDLNTLQDAFVHNAEVIVSDGTDSVYLREYAIENQNSSFYFYSVDSTQSGATPFLGATGKEYSLYIQVDGKAYTSKTSLLPANPLDSLWTVPDNNPNNTNPDSRWIMARYKAPANAGNNTSRYFIRINGSGYIAPRYSVIDGSIMNDNNIELQLRSGRFDEEGQIAPFNLGDTVVIKWCAIDKPVFDFWRTLEFSSSSVGNPFASPVEISTNIEGGALGVWSGYTPSYHAIVVQDSL